MVGNGIFLTLIGIFILLVMRDIVASAFLFVIGIGAIVMGVRDGRE